MEKLKAGDHLGHAVAWGVLEGKKAPQVFVQTDIGLSWFGSLAEGKAREITLEALVVMGFQGDDLTDLVKDPVNALDKNKDVRFKVEYDAGNPDKEGNPRAKIAWVNEVGGGFKNQMDEGNALKALSGLKVKGDLTKLRKEKGVHDMPKRETPGFDENEDGDIPF